jgi:hypothetical protein
VSGLAAIVTLGPVGGDGGIVSGLAAIVTLGPVGGDGGIVSGLAATVTLGPVGGDGGIVSGLAAMATLGPVGGAGGIVRGLASAYVATANNAAPRATLRILDIEVIVVHSLLKVRTTHEKSNPKVSFPLLQK